MENNQPQKNDILLPGGFGSITIKNSGTTGIIASAMKNNDGSVTLTVKPNKKELLPPVIEDINHKIVQPNQFNDTGRNG